MLINNLFISIGIFLLIVIVMTITAIHICRKDRYNSYESLLPFEDDGKPILLSPSKIAGIGVLLMMFGTFGCIGAVILFSQAPDFRDTMFWASVVLTILMVLMIAYGRHLYLIHQKVIQLFFDKQGFYHADLQLSNLRRPFWAFLSNRAFVFVAYSSLQAVEIVERMTGSGLVIVTATKSFTLPVYCNDEQEVMEIAKLIKAKANIK